MAFVSSPRRVARASLALALTTPAALGLGQGRTVASAPSHAGDAGSDADAKTAPGGDAGSDAHASATVGRSCPAGPPPRLPVRYSGFAREGYSYSREHPESVHGQVHHVRGALGASALEEVTGRYLGRFRLCYWSALRTHPNLAGRVAVVLAVGPDGAVVSAERDAKHTTLPSDAAVTCVLDHLRSVSFPAAERAAPTDACVDVDLYP
jgi:hypothetical protein